MYHVANGWSLLLCSCSEWLREAQEYCVSDFDVFLVACKRDLVVSRSYVASISLIRNYTIPPVHAWLGGKTLAMSWICVVKAKTICDTNYFV